MISAFISRDDILILCSDGAHNNLGFYFILEKQKKSFFKYSINST